ncbi:MAG TPA: TonB-dependent receptor [Rhizomicrobium sp.]|nr:TonB-dependent receptor [Rhizomicrobium sp.]
MRSRYVGVLLASSAIASLMTSAARADGIETVTVTAEKRVEDVQKVPVAVTALEGSALDQQGIIGFADLGTHVPSLRFGNNPTGGENAITLRGIGSQNVTSGGESPVAYSVDGVYQARTTAVDPEFYDIDRIEVLRGPQGTLYGRNSVGGSVNVITNHPTDTFAASGDAMFGNYSAWTLRGFLNTPLIDGDTKVNARITGVWSEHDPYQQNFSTTAGHTNEADGQDLLMLRGQVEADFSPDVTFLLSAYTMQNNRPVATKLAWGEAPLANQGRFVGQVYDPNPRHTDSGFPDTATYWNSGVSGTLTWNLGFATLTSITGYTDGKWRSSNDSDSVSLDLSRTDFWTMRSKQYSEEVRLASNDGDSPLKWILGFFYFDEKVRQDYLFTDTGLNAPFGTGFIFANGGDIDSESWAPFGQIDFDLSKTSAGIPLTLTGGLRYSTDRKHIADFLDYAIPDFAFDFVQSKDVSHTWSQLTGKVGAAYQANDDTMIYANVSRGYLAGGELMGNFPGIYDPETATAYEAGLKTQFADNRVQLNLAAFYTRISNMQVFVQDIAGSRIDNAASARVKGLEGEAIFLPTDELRFNVAVSLLDAKYNAYSTIDNRYAGPAPGCDPVTRLCDFSGHRLVQTPNYTIDVGAQYTFDTSIGTFTPRADIFFSGDLYFLSANTFRDRQGAYTLTNLNIRWDAPDEHWFASAFVNNLSDEDIISGDGVQSNTIGLGFGMDNYTYMPPRTFGLRVGIKT